MRKILEEHLVFVLDLLLRVIGLLLILLVCVNKDRTIVIVRAVTVVVRADRVRVVAASAALVLLRRFFLAASLLLRRLFLADVTAV